MGMSGWGIVHGQGGLGSPVSQLTPNLAALPPCSFIPKSSVVEGPVPHSSWLEFY